MKTVNALSKIRLVILVIGTICYLCALLLNTAYQTYLIDICLALLAIQFVLQAIEIHIKGKEEKVDEANK